MKNQVPTSVVIPTGKNSVIVTIPTVDDDEIALAGQISFSLIESADYSIIENLDEASIVVLNNDYPELSISADQVAVKETDPDAEFTISVDSAPLVDTVINLDISQVGNFISWRSIRNHQPFGW